MNKILLKTARLIIRNFTQNDHNDLFEYLSDKETYIYEPGEPISLQEAITLCDERSKNDHFLAVQLKDTVIGHIYFCQIEPQKLMTWEIGYIFNKKFHGNGFATEAVKAVIEYGFYERNVHKIIAHCSPDNVPSWKLLERVNMKREGTLRENIYFNKNEHGIPLWLNTYEYGILKNDLEDKIG